MLHIRYPLNFPRTWSAHAVAPRVAGRSTRTQPTPTSVLTLGGVNPGLRLSSLSTSVHSSAEIQE